MKENRIYFPGNPWSEGHPIKDFQWTAEIREGNVWFLLHLETEDYYAERDIKDNEREYESDWEAPIAWGNYHNCTISATEWHHGGFLVCPMHNYSSEYINGREFKVDSLPLDLEKLEDWDDLAFHTYLLGHDSVANHKIIFTRKEQSEYFDMFWQGKIALSYVGDYEFRYSFQTKIGNIRFPEI